MNRLTTQLQTPAPDRPAQRAERTGSGSFLWVCLGLMALLSALFFRSFKPAETLFSNDGPLGAVVAQSSYILTNFLGVWQDLNWIGGPTVSLLPQITDALYLVCGPIAFSKFYAPLSLLFLGLTAWVFFRQLGFGSMVCLLGALAAALNMNIFSNVCWGLPTRALTLGSTFLALAALQSGWQRYPLLKSALAGLAVGLGLMEGYDMGALFSLYVAAFALFLAWNRPGPVRGKWVQGLSRIALVAVCAAVVAAQALTVLIGTQVKGIVGMEGGQKSKEENWDWATQWSLPKIEALRVVIPGLFGYRLDTPGGGNYWGTVGRQPGWEQHHQGFARHSGSGEYAGLLVVLLALWAVAQSLRGQASPFSLSERRFIWFWGGLGLVSLLLAFGKYAPFYRLIYELPFFSTVRNPIKFMHPFHLTLLVLFGYGLQDLSRRYLAVTATRTLSLGDHLRAWWANAPSFDKKWCARLGIASGASALAWLLYAASRTDLQRYLQTNGFVEPLAAQISRFSLGEMGWFVLFLALAFGAMTVVLSRALAGRRAPWGWGLLGLLLVADMVRADRPWIIYYNYKEKYASNPIIDILREKPYEQRVSVLPPFAVESMPLLQQLYGIEWLQHLFQFYKIQSLDVIQEPRSTIDNVAYRAAFPRTNVLAQLRLWELTNTRYLLGLAGGFVDALNQQLDPAQHRFRLHTAFDLVPKSSAASPSANLTLEDLTAVLKPDGRFALIEFTGVLPRAKLYAHWQLNTNGPATLQQLADPTFEPAKTVLVADSLPPPLPPASTNQNAGSVEFVHYEPKRVRLQAKAEVPCVLLLNDKYDPDWKAWVDGQPAPVLRCNFIMRGLLLQPGPHRVEFRYLPTVTGLYVSLAALIVGLGICGFLAVFRERAGVPAGGSAVPSRPQTAEVANSPSPHPKS